MKYINTRIDRLLGQQHFFEYVCPADWQPPRRGLSEYFEQHHFQVGLLYSDYYSQLNGIKSDQYFSSDMYYAGAMPALNRYQFRVAYTDKNLFYALFPDAVQPECVVKRMNGVFYSPEGEVLTLQQAISLSRSCAEPCIIKPSIDTHSGQGVDLFRPKTEDEVKTIFEKYGLNFLVQKSLRQHEMLARFNPTSVNTLRIYTYRKLNGEIVVLSTFVRFGGEGAIKDNVSAGGGISKIGEDGIVGDGIFRLKTLSVGSLRSERGLSDVLIPNFQEALDLTVRLHANLPYFDWVGWDIVIREDGVPVMLEFNVRPFAEGPQMVSGPVFGKYTDEVVERMSKIKKEKRVFVTTIFERGNEYDAQYGQSMQVEN